MSLGGSLVSRVRNRTRIVSTRTPDVFEGALKPLVERLDCTTETSRVKEGYVHASSLLDFCPRRWRLVQIDNPELVNAPRSADRVMWMLGRAAEHHVRTSVIRALDWHGVYGHWSCACGEKTHEGRGRPTMVCNRCNHPVTNYGEWTAWNHDLKIVGNPDLLVMHGRKLRVVEIKSMNKKEFDAMSSAKGNHVFQATTYQKMLSESPDMREEVDEEATVFYVCKDYSFAGTPYKEFSFSASDYYPAVNAAFEQVVEFRAAERRGVLPPRLEACSSPMSPKAKKCVTCAGCFSR